jgi:hypothetical protein
MKTTKAQLTDEQQSAGDILAGNLLGALDEIAKIKQKDTMEWDWYKEYIFKPLKESLTAAKKEKVPSSAKFYVGGNEMTFAEMDKQASGIEGEFKKAMKMKDDKLAVFKDGQTPANLKRYEAFRAKYTKGLSGDKLKIMEEDILINSVSYSKEPPFFLKTFYDVGKKPLKTPQDFADAQIWASTDVVYANDDHLKTDPHWRVYISHFKAMKLVNSTSTRGSGKAAPDSEFKFKAK